MTLPTFGNLMRLMFRQPIGPREATVGEILGRKVLKTEIKDVIRRDEDDKEKKAHPALEQLQALAYLVKQSSLYKEAPFKSEAQRRLFYAKEERGEISKAEVNKWEAETPKGKKLPEHVEKKASPQKVAGLLGMAGMGLGFSAKRGLQAAGAGLMLGDAAIQGFKMKTPSQAIQAAPRVASLADRLIKISAGVMFQNLKAGKPATIASVVGDAPAARAMSGKAMEERVSGAGEGAHINRPAI